jgi:membrane-bound serine protease (ClpP class)
MRRFIPSCVFVALLCASAVFGFASTGATAKTAPSPVSSPQASPSVRQSKPVVDVIKVNGVMDKPMSDYILGSLADAEAAGSTVVIQLNSPGSLGIDGSEIVQAIRDSEVPVIVWVGPAPAQAAGTAFEMTQAAAIDSMAPGAGLGPAGPSDLATDAPQTTQPTEAVDARDALDQGLITTLDPNQPTPGSVAALLAQVDGRTVQTAAGPVQLNTRIAVSSGEQQTLLRFHDLGPWRRILHAVASPSAIYLLLVLGFAGIAFEMTQPGFGFAGICGVLALGLAAYGIWIVPPNWLGFALLVGGIGMLIVDVVMRKLGVLSAVGLLLFAVGTWLVYGGVAPAIDIPVWLMVLGVVSTGLYYGFGLTVAQQARDRIASTQLGLVGLVGETRGELNPEGAVHVKGTLWRGRSVEGAIPAATKVRVRGVDGLVLRVEPEPDSEEDE